MSFYNQTKETVAALVMFYSPKSVACQQMMPIVEDIKHEVGDSAQVILVDVENNPEEARRENIVELPTFGVYRYGRCHWRAVGLVSKADLLGHLVAAADPTPANELGRR